MNFTYGYWCMNLQTDFYKTLVTITYARFTYEFIFVPNPQVTLFYLQISSISYEFFELDNSKFSSSVLRASNLDNHLHASEKREHKDTLNANLLFKKHLNSQQYLSTLGQIVFYSNPTKSQDHIRQIGGPELTYACLKIVYSCKEILASIPRDHKVDICFS